MPTGFQEFLREGFPDLLIEFPEDVLKCLPEVGKVGHCASEIGRECRSPVHSLKDGIHSQSCRIPVKPAVEATCELLGLDPLYIANEGKLICICAEADAQRLLEVMRRHPLGTDAAIIGSVQEDPYCFVQMETRFGGVRVVDWLVGEPLPRIC